MAKVKINNKTDSRKKDKPGDIRPKALSLWKKILLAWLYITGIGLIFILGYIFLNSNKNHDSVSDNQVMGRTDNRHYDAGLIQKNTRIDTAITRKWILINNNDAIDSKLTEAEYTVNVVNNNIPYPGVAIFLDGKEIRQYLKNSTNKYIYKLNAENYSIGEHSITAKILDVDLAAGNTSFVVSYPLFVTWTIDWEGSDCSQSHLNAMDSIANKYQIPLTNLFNPRVFIADDISQSNVNKLVNWVSNGQKQRGDEIGLHMHMHYDMIIQAGLTPKTSPRWGGRTNGHDVLTSAYDKKEFTQLLNWAKAQFTKYNLPVPTTYRAGGWFADLENIQTLNENGFTIDTSGREKYNWGNAAGFWDLPSTTKPYQVCRTDQNKTCTDHMEIYEFPNNGWDTTNNKASVLKQKFDDNYKGIALAEAQTITYMSHAHWFVTYDNKTMIELMNYIDGNKAEGGNGPLIYTTLNRALKYWRI